MVCCGKKDDITITAKEAALAQAEEVGFLYWHNNVYLSTPARSYQSQILNDFLDFSEAVRDVAEHCCAAHTIVRLHIPGRERFSSH
jgi:hypothetical protein